jgi:phage-related protein
MQEAILALIDNLPILMEALGEAIPKMLVTVLDPTFWARMAIIIAVAFIRQIPNMVKAFIEGFGRGITDVVRGFDPVIKAFRDIGNIFDGIGKTLNNVKDAFQSLIDKIKGIGGGAFGGGGGGIFDPFQQIVGSIGGMFKGFQYGGLVAANGLIVPGQSTIGDKVPVRVNSREMILSQDQQSRLFSLLQGVIEGRGNERPVEIHTTVKIEEKELGRAIQRMTVNGWA